MNRNAGYRWMQVLSAIVVLSLSGILTGCSNEPGKETPQPVNANTPPAGAVAMLVNLPTEEEASQYPGMGTLYVQETEEAMIVVCIKEATSIEVVEIEIQEDGTFADLGTIYSVTNAPINFAIELQAIRPEGAPSYKLVFTINGVETIYYISYNGKDGNPKIEYVY